MVARTSGALHSAAHACRITQQGSLCGVAQRAALRIGVPVAGRPAGEEVSWPGWPPRGRMQVSRNGGTHTHEHARADTNAQKCATRTHAHSPRLRTHTQTHPHSHTDTHTLTRSHSHSALTPSPKLIHSRSCSHSHSPFPHLGALIPTMPVGSALQRRKNAVGRTRAAGPRVTVPPPSVRCVPRRDCRTLACCVPTSPRPYFTGRLRCTRVSRSAMCARCAACACIQMISQAPFGKDRQGGTWAREG